MGEFHVEDTYEIAQPTKEATIDEKPEESGNTISAVQEQAVASGRSERQVNESRHAGSQRSTQQLYQPRKRQEYSRSGLRGGRAAGSMKAGAQRVSGTQNNTSTPQNPPERGKRKKAPEDDVSKGGDDTKTSRSTPRDDVNRRGGTRSAQHVCLYNCHYCSYVKIE